MERRRRGQPRKTIPEPTIASPFLQLSKMPDFTVPPSAEETLGQGTLAGPEMERRQRGRPPKTIPEPTIASPFQQGLTGLERVDDEAGLLEKTRKDLVNARVRFEDDRWLQKLRDSDLRAWCKPVRDLQLETVQSFYIPAWLWRHTTFQVGELGQCHENCGRIPRYVVQADIWIVSQYTM
jgi:hypothetical protein